MLKQEVLARFFFFFRDSGKSHSILATQRSVNRRVWNVKRPMTMCTSAGDNTYRDRILKVTVASFRVCCPLHVNLASSSSSLLKRDSILPCLDQQVVTLK